MATNEGRLSVVTGSSAELDESVSSSGFEIKGQYKASETIPSLPGRQLIPSSKCLTPASGQSGESSATHLPSPEFSSSRPSLPLGTLKRTKHLRPRPHCPRRFL